MRKQPSKREAIKGYKVTPYKKGVYLQHLRNGMRRGAAARALGVCRKTIALHTKSDPEFAKAVTEAELDANEAVENALYKAAVEDRNVTAIQVWLYNRCPVEWADKRRTNHSLTVTTRFEDATPEEKKKRLERVLRLAGVTVTGSQSGGVASP